MGTKLNSNKLDKRIFISYSWKDEKIVDKIDGSFNSIGISLIRDKREILFKGNIKEYMKKIRTTDYVLMIISDAFLKSLNCWYEVLEFIKDENYKSRILPIILNNAKINTPNEKLVYIKYWCENYETFLRDAGQVPLAASSNLSTDAKHYEDIINNIGVFLEIINDMKYEFYNNLENGGYKKILEYIGYNENDIEMKFMEILFTENSEQQDIAIDDFIFDHPNDASGYSFKGTLEYKRRKYNQSIILYTKAIKLKSDFYEAYLNRGGTYCDVGDYDKALDDSELAIKYSTTLTDKVNAYTLRGTVYTHKQEFTKAREDFNFALKLKPDNSELFLNLSLLYSRLGEVEKSKAALNKAIDLGNIGAYYNRGCYFMKIGDFNKAIEDFNTAMQLSIDDPNDENILNIEEHKAEVCNALAETYGNKGEFDKSIEYYTKAIEYFPIEASRYYCGRALAYNKKGNSKKALIDFEIAISLDPKCASAYHEKGRLFLNKKQYGKALIEFEKALALEPDNADIFNDRGTIYGIKNKFNKAISDYSRAIELDKNNVVALINLGQLYAKIENYDKAIENITRAIALKYENSDAYFIRGLAYEELNRKDEALKDYNRVIELDSTFADAYVRSGFINYDKGDYKKALVDFNRAIELQCTHLELAYYYRGSIYHINNNDDKALSDYNESIKRGFRYAEVYVNRGSIFVDEKKFVKAIKEYNTAIKLDPSYAEAYYYRGNSYASVANYMKAIDDYKKSIELNNNSKEIYNSLGNTYFEIENYNESIIYYKKCNGIKNNYFLPLLGLAQIYFIKNEKSKAKHYLDLVIAIEPVLLEGMVGIEKLESGEFSFTNKEKSILQKMFTEFTL